MRDVLDAELVPGELAVGDVGEVLLKAVVRGLHGEQRRGRHGALPVGDEVAVAPDRAGHVAGFRRPGEAVAIAEFAAVLEGEDEVEAIAVAEHFVVAGHGLLIAIAADGLRGEEVLREGIGPDEVFVWIKIEEGAAHGADARRRNYIARERLPLDDAVDALHRAGTLGIA